MQPISYK